MPLMRHHVGMVQGGVETEVKLRIANRAQVENVLEREGFQIAIPRVFEANEIYDRPDASLRAAGMLLRLRDLGTHGVITWKGPVQSGPHKARPEIETTLGSVDPLKQILQHLGLSRMFRYEKYRTEYRGPGPGTVTVDETPIGDYLELEGPPDWIDATAKVLGFRPSDYVLDSYGTLYLDDCKRRGIAPSNMVFNPESESPR